MLPRRVFFFLSCCIFLATGALGADPAEQSLRPDKTLVTDGHVVHDLGRLSNHVTNFGLIGSRPTQPSPFGDAPSARWPDGDGVDYLWSAGLWVGGTVLGERLVSTGQFVNEIMASDAPGDTIFPAQRGMPRGNRYPWPGADDDADGLEDEDPLDGLDNDSDGRVDEDFAAVSDQDYHCAMIDNTPLAQDIFPDHTPLNIRVEQRSFQWADPLAADFIGYEYRITNIGVVSIDALHCGLFSDFDIGNAGDDLAGGWRGEWMASDGSMVPVSVAYMHDSVPSFPYVGYAGWVMCGFVRDATTAVGADPLALPTLQIYRGNMAFEQGGDPVNDDQRYQVLSSGDWDDDPLPGQIGDYRVVLATAGLPSLAPGESVTFRAALVVGEGLAGMLNAAAEAVATAQGQFYDRDEDPANGKEFQVPWIRPGEEPVAAMVGELVAARTTGAVELEFDLRHAEEEAVTVVRRATIRASERRWRDLPPSGRIVDRDDAGWPRTYELVVALAGAGDLVLDAVKLAGPARLDLVLKATPNPFNPQVMFSFALSEPVTATLIVHDLRGRAVRTLLRDESLAGQARVAWDGTDDAGQAVASGVYVARLRTEKETVERRVSLVR